MASLLAQETKLIETTVTPVVTGVVVGQAAYIQCENLGANIVGVEVAFSIDGVVWVVVYEATNDLADIAVGVSAATKFNLFYGAILRIRATATGGQTTLKTSVWLLPVLIQPSAG